MHGGKPDRSEFSPDNGVSPAAQTLLSLSPILSPIVHAWSRREPRRPGLDYGGAVPVPDSGRRRVLRPRAGSAPMTCRAPWPPRPLNVCRAGWSRRRWREMEPGQVNDEELWSIGAFAKRSGLTVEALRHYDVVGLLLPADVDLRIGYRVTGLTSCLQRG
jgi:hypothetical protein